MTGRGGRWVWASVAALLALAVASAVAIAARSLDFRDEFTSFDTRRWVTIDRPFGHGQVRSENIAVADGRLSLRLPAGRLDGAELRTTSLFTYGSFRARMKVANAPSSLTAFFLYKKPDYEQEIDIEIFNDSTGRIMFSTYSGGAMRNNVIVESGVDLSADFHEYAIEYTRGQARFLLDGRELRRFTTGVPRSSMYLFVNAWFPSWLAGESPATDRFTVVDWMEHTGR